MRRPGKRRSGDDVTEQAAFDFAAARDDAAGEVAAGEVAGGEVAEAPTYTVVELNSLVRDVLRRAQPDEVWVRGEVQNLSTSSAGHSYFSLVEKAVRGDRAQGRLDVALFRDDARGVRRALKEVPGAELGNDVEVRIRGRVTVYPPTGRYQLVMTGIDPVFTVGGIAANRERVLRALAAEGLLELNGRLPLPPVPLRIGLVTSSGSAAYHDFVRELEGAPHAWQVVVADVRVQGAAAAGRIKWALGQLAQLDLDVVVLARGGGSRADLAPFDTELVARAIAAMDVPVITGVGHEIDRSVADEVAHSACKTPTACAQLLVRQVDEFVGALDHASQRVAARARQRMAVANRELDDAARRASRSALVAVGREHARLDRVHGRLDELGRRRGSELRAGLDVRARRLVELGHHATRARQAALVARHRDVATHAQHQLERAAMRLAHDDAVVRALDPRRVLERGYSITRGDDGRVLRAADAVAPGALVHTELAGGRITSRVEAVDHTTADPNDTDTETTTEGPGG
jgi:exodeoxyribonuclease VII large subunit